jgi:hypothetical protein
MPPSTAALKGPRPSTTLKQREQSPPDLSASGEAAKKNARAFVDWAAASTKDQADLVRKTVGAARENPEVIAAFCNEAFASQTADHSRALVALSLLGEAKSKHGEECLSRFLKQPLPEKGTVVEGEILEQKALAVLQAKAVDGLAYLRTESGDRLVLEAASQHPSRIVRAEAIEAYLWNHEYSAAARETLKARVREDERIFLDRVVRRDGESRESFNPKLSTYLKAHPEVRPPAPEKSKAKPKPKPSVGNPPAF